MENEIVWSLLLLVCRMQELGEGGKGVMIWFGRQEWYSTFLFVMLEEGWDSSERVHILLELYSICTDLKHMSRWASLWFPCVKYDLLSFCSKMDRWFPGIGWGENFLVLSFISSIGCNMGEMTFLLLVPLPSPSCNFLLRIAIVLNANQLRSSTAVTLYEEFVD